MTIFSVAEADFNLSDLIDRALRGEGVVVTRQGTPVVEIKAIGAQRDITEVVDLEWLRKRRITLKAGSPSATETLAAMRDEF